MDPNAREPSLGWDRHPTRRQFLQRAGGATLALTAASPLLAACGASSQPAANVGLRVGTLSDQDTLSPLLTVASLEPQWLVYSKLLVFDQHLQPQLSPLTTARTISDGGRTITYKLNPKAKFHDGKPLTSADVKFTYELVRETQLSYAAAFLTNLTGVDTPDAQTAVAHFSAPQADDPGIQATILPKHIWQGMSKDELAKFPDSEMIGSGPFKFKKWEHSRSLEIVRDPDYWGPKPGVASVSWLVFANPETMAISMRQGNIDVTYPLSTSIWKGLSGAADVVTKEYVPNQFDHFGINVWKSAKSKGNPLLRDKTLRQALVLALDRDKLVELVLEGHGTRGTTIIPPGLTQWHLQIPEAEQLNNDPARAKAMLDAAGYREKNGVRTSPDGKPLHFRMFISEFLDRLKSAGELIIPMMKNIGVTMDMTVMTDADLAARVFTAADFDTYVWTWGTPPTPTYMLSVEKTGSFHVSSDTYYSNPEFDKLAAAQAAETDVKKRQQLVYQAQKMFYDDAAYGVLYYPSQLEAYSTKRLKGWLDQPNGITNNATEANFLALQPV